jgi:hypothetical protein
VEGKREREVARSCSTLPDPVDRGLPGSSVHGIFRARGLEWGAVAFSEYETTIIPILFFRITVLFVT